MKRVLVFLLIMVFPILGMTATIHVPGDQPTIQEGIDAAVDGDTVLVAPGTYVENIHFLGKAITVISEQGPEVTIIDGGSPPNPDYASVVSFNNDEGPDSILEGFTVTNGTGRLFPGQGYNGGGIFTHFSSPTITGNIITGNMLLYDYSHGGGIFANNASPTITGNVISGNRAAAGGGIDFQFYCFSIVSDNTITENTSPYFGGGIAVSYNSDPVISNNIISENWSGQLGGGMLIGIDCSPTTSSNTIHLNSALVSGGGIHIEDNCHPVVTSTILWGNDAPLGSEGYIGSTDSLTISFSDVEGGTGSIGRAEGSTLNWGGGMIDEDPLFLDPESGDYHLCQDPCQPGVINPCVNWGHPFSPVIPGTTRTDGYPDVGRLDMGYHYALLETVTADLGCVPDSGVLPFVPQFSVTLGNAVAYDRMIAGRIDLTIAGGATFQGWRAGFANLGPSETFVTVWQQTLPALERLVGSNVFELQAEDVTPPPFNQPPYPPAGDSDTASCMVTGIAP